MELSEGTVICLSALENPKIINDVTFGNLLDVVVSQLCGKPEGKYVAQLCGSKPDVVNEIHGNLLSLLIDAARLDLDRDKLRLVLANANVNGPRGDRLCDLYSRHKETIRTSLRQIGNSLPHVVDVNWRLDYCVGSNTENTVDARSYTVQLSTIRDQGKLETIKFTCKTHQLQELVHKMKDAVRHVEKLKIF